MGKFMDAPGTSAHAGANETAEVVFPHKMEPKIVGGLLNLNHNVLACASHNKDASQEYSQEYGPVAKMNLGLCVDQTAVVASDFAVTTAEVFRQECRTDNRGRGSDVHGEGAAFNNRSRSGGRYEKKIQSYAIPDNNSLASSSISDVERRDSYSDDNDMGKTHKSGDGSRRRSSRSLSSKSPESSRYLETLYPENATEFDASPPRVPRTSSAKEFQPRVDNAQLMEARMELFRLGQSEEDSPQSEAKLTRALQDLKRQDKVIDGWKRQLEMTQKHLDETFTELEKSKKESQEKQQKATEIRAKAVQERKKLQELYDAELEQRKTLQDSVGKLQREVSSLKVALRNARNSSGVSNASKPRGATETASTGQVISLKAEIVELRSQLAEAHAASIDDHSTLNSTGGEVEELRKRLKAAEVELNQLRGRGEDAEKTKHKFEESERLLKAKIERIESEAKEMQKTLEESLKAAVEEENELRSELGKAKANVQRLERERSRKRVHSAADVDRLTKQLEKAKEEIAQLKQQQETEEKAAKEESQKLKGELSDLRQKLFDATKEFASKATMSLEERMKMATDLKDLRGEVSVLRNQLQLKTEEADSQAKKISGLEAKSKDIPDRITSSRQITELQDEIKTLKDNEVSLREEITQYKSLLEHKKAEVANAHSALEAQSCDESANLEKLRSQVEELKLSEEKRAEQEEMSANLRKEVIVLEKKVEFLQRKMKAQEARDLESKAAEESFKGEIATLKAKLGESESKCTEESFRAEEERRISKENETRFTQELDELRHENEQSTEDKMQLRQELEDLRKQLASGIGGSSRSVTKSGDNESTEVPSKVIKLRSELALARARLAAAREQTAMFSLSPTRGPIPAEKREEILSEYTTEYSDRSSVGSVGSCWAPPGIMVVPADAVESPPQVFASEAEDSSAHDAASSTADPTSVHFDPEAEPEEPNTDSEPAKVSFWERSLMEEESKFEESKVSPEFMDKSKFTPSPRSACSFGEKSLIDEDVGETFPESSLQDEFEARFGLQTPEKARLGTGVDELRRQLLESSKRLEKANTRLNGLVDLPELKKVNGFIAAPYRGINRDTFLVIAEEEKVGGAIDEVVTSDADGIEVQRVQYADV